MGVDVKTKAPVDPPIESVVIQEAPFKGIRIKIAGSSDWLEVCAFDKTNTSIAYPEGKPCGEQGRVHVSDIPALITALQNLYREMMK